MSSSPTGLENLSITDNMPLSPKSDESPSKVVGPSGRAYDLTGLSPIRAGIAFDGLESKSMRLLPILKKARFPESGFTGFEVTEVHSVRIPLSDDQDQELRTIQCDCPTFQRLEFCSHITWLYDGLKASIDTKPPSPTSAVERLTDNDLARRFKEVASSIPDQARGLTERINRLQPNQPSYEVIDRAVLDVFAVLDGSQDDSPRKRRRGDVTPEDMRPSSTKFKTCLEIPPAEFFNEVQPPENNIQELIVAGDPLASFKGLVRYGTVFREALFSVVDPSFRAEDFIQRIDARLSEWKERWENYRKDRRTTVPLSFITDYANLLREAIRQLRLYENTRDCPDSFYDDAIDLGITMLDEVCKSNSDLYEGHSRQNSQARHTVPQLSRDRNLLVNMILDPPTQISFIRSLVEMLFEFKPERFDNQQISKLRRLYAGLRETDQIQLQHISPLKNFVDVWVLEQSGSDDEGDDDDRSSSPSSRPSTQQASSTSQNPQSQRRYREIRAAPRY